jgi:parvulin-like peptidyl-prolyl isomerase
MHPSATRTLAALLLAVVALAATAAFAQNIPGAAARVNGVEISNFRLERHFEEFLRSQRRNVTAMINPKVYKKLKREALDQLIERELLWQAARADGRVATDAEVQKALQAMAAQIKGGREAYLRRLAQAGFDEASYAEYVRQEMSGAAWLQRRASAASPVSDADVAAAYQANLNRYQRPETVRAQHILLKVAPDAPADAHAAARSALAKIRAEAAAGADFGDLARKHSQDSTASDGGDLGDVARGRTVKPFEDALFALAPGEVSGVVQTRFGYHLIRAESRQPAAVRPLEEARDDIRAALTAERGAARAREIVAELKAAARIEILVHLD